VTNILASMSFKLKPIKKHSKYTTFLLLLLLLLLFFFFFFFFQISVCSYVLLAFPTETEKWKNTKNKRKKKRKLVFDKGK